MKNPYGTERKCAQLSEIDLENTFFYPGPGLTRTPPGAQAQAAWDMAAETCIECPVFLSCREAHWGEEYGVWGGTDQYERYLYRRRLVKAVRKMTAEEREAFAAAVYHRSKRRTLDALARETGHSRELLLRLVEEHEDRLAAARKARQVARAEARGVIGWTPGAKFPVKPPMAGDGWVWWRSRAVSGHYVAQNPEGTWVRMKFRAHAGQPVIRWFPAHEVRMHKEVEVAINEFGKGMEKKVARHESAA